MGDHNPVEELLTKYRRAVQTKDADAFAALYDDDITVFDMWGQWEYRGIDGWRQMAMDWFGSLGSDGIAVELSDIVTLVSGDLGIAHAVVTFKGLSSSGEELRAQDNRLTWAVRRTFGGAWKVVHEHTSAPLDPQTARAITRK